MPSHCQSRQAMPVVSSCALNLEHLKNGWYILMTKAGEESRAQRNLENQGFNVYGPTIKGGTKRVALFPGYIFVHMNADDMSRYHRIRSTPGVFRVVCFNRIACCLYAQGRFSSPVEALLPHPIKNGDALIERIRQVERKMNQLQENQPQLQTFREGDPVTVADPLFDALNTEFARQLSKNRSLILIKFMVQWRDSNNVVHEVVETRHSVVVKTQSLQLNEQNEAKPVTAKSRFCELCTAAFEGRAYYGFDDENQPIRVGHCCRDKLPRLLNPANLSDRDLWQKAR